MSTVRFLTDLIEVPCDKKGEREWEEIDENLPHHELISKLICESWNTAHMEQYFDGVLKDNIASAIMNCMKDGDGKTVAVITVTGKPNFRFSEKRRNEIYDQVSAQLSDGWGESFFHKEFTDEHGARFTVL